MKRLIALAVLLVLVCPMRVKAEECCEIYASHANEGGKIAITFDDGPHPRKTRKILELLKKYDVHATFFVVGENVGYYPEVFLDTVRAGHEIGNHTETHAVLKGLGREGVSRELQKTEDAIGALCELKPKLLRPPCGLYDREVEEEAARRGYAMALWTVDTRDWAHVGKEEIVSNVLKNVKSGSIILFHDYTAGENHTLDALEVLLPALIERGYTPVTVSELIASH